VSARRSIAVITTTRADYGLLYWILRAIREHPSLELKLIAGGAHLSSRHGLTRDFIQNNGFEIAATVDFLSDGDSDLDSAVAGGQAVVGFAGALHKLRPDMVLLLGDRYETLAAAFAAATLGIAIGHIHGGETTEGALDEGYRHAITKLSHLHFAATKQAARRIIQMGEQPDRVAICGAPGIETAGRTNKMDIQQLGAALHVGLEPGFILVTYHPAALCEQSVGEQIQQLLDALTEMDHQLVFTRPNADAGNRQITVSVEKFSSQRKNAHLFASVGQETYVNLMRHAAVMVGNSSSGIIEAPSIPLAVVNVGPRQQGRLRAGNVIDVECRAEAIVDGIRHALADEFQRSLSRVENPYGNGNTSGHIVEVLAGVELGPKLLQKRFFDIELAEGVLG